MTETNDKIEKQQQANTQAETSRKTLEAELAFLQTQISSQTDTLNSVQAKRDSYKEELTALQEEIAEQYETAQQAESLKNELETELAAARLQITELQSSESAAIDVSSETRVQLEQQLATERARFNKAEQTMQQLQADNHGLTAQLATVNQELASQQQATELVEI